MTVKKSPDIEADVGAAATVSDKPTKKTSDTTCGFCVYIGPSIRGVIQSGTVYPEPKELTIIRLISVIEKYPKIALLVVSGDTLSADRVRASTPGNLLHEYYMQLAERTH